MKRIFDCPKCESKAVRIMYIENTMIGYVENTINVSTRSDSRICLPINLFTLTGSLITNSHNAIVDISPINIPSLTNPPTAKDSQMATIIVIGNEYLRKNSLAVINILFY